MLECRLVAKRIVGFANDLLRNRRGAVAIEYGLMVAMIAIALVGVLTLRDVAKLESENFNLLSDVMSK